MIENQQFNEFSGLPVSFKVLTAIPMESINKKNRFFHSDYFQGFSIAEKFYKPISKTVNWALFLTNDGQTK